MRTPTRLLCVAIMSAGCGSEFEVPEPDAHLASEGGVESGSAIGRPPLGAVDSARTSGDDAANRLAIAAGGDAGATEDATAVLAMAGDGPVPDVEQEGGNPVPLGDSDACVPTGPELCDGKDNDCNGIIDDGPLCACEVHAFDAREYLFCSRVQSWLSAAEFCVARGATLVTIGSKEEDSWLEGTAVGIAPIPWWIGFNDRTTEKSWVWVAGTASGYLHWAMGQPNNHDGNEDCAALNGSAPAEGWNDLPCGDFYPFICESPIGGLSWP
jgi:hypothetical protein